MNPEQEQEQQARQPRGVVSYREWAANFRDNVIRSSPQQRQPVAHGHNGMVRTIMETLYDRQCRGPVGLVWQPQSPPATAEESSTTTTTLRRSAAEAAAAAAVVPSSSLKKTTDQEGRKSPSTVLDTATSPEDRPGYNNSSSSGVRENLTTATIAAISSSSAATGRTKATTSCCRIHDELLYFVEYTTGTRYHSAFFHHLGGHDRVDGRTGHLEPVSSHAVSTISVAFSWDGQTMASTHGDHSVKVTSCATGQLLQSLEGHARTPWTVKYHPQRADILASGCLGHQVRVWNWKQAVCLQMVRLEYAIISLSFHPSGQVLAVANGTRLHFWGIANLDIQPNEHANSHNSNRAAVVPLRHGAFPAPSAPTSGSTTLLEMNQGHMLRCVHFTPDGKSLIIGGVNSPTDDPRNRRTASTQRPNTANFMSFYLRLWEFHLQPCLQVKSSSNNPPLPIRNPRILVPRALLYNDGGFDVSPDGTTLCACVEYWLPDGVDNAMDLLTKEQHAFSQTQLKAERQQQQNEDEHQAALVDAMSMDALAVASPKKRKEPLEQGDSSLSSPDGNAAATASNSTTTTPLFRRDASSPAPTFSDVAVPPAPQTPEPNSALLSTPSNPRPNEPMRLSPPPPPGRRLIPNHQHQQQQQQTTPSHHQATVHSPPPLPPGTHSSSNYPPPTGSSHHSSVSVHGSNSGNTTATAAPRPPHPLSALTSTNHPETRRGRYVPHVVTLSLDITPLPDEILARIDRHYAVGNNSNNHNHLGQQHPEHQLSPQPISNTTRSPVLYPAVALGYRPRLGQLIRACPLDAGKATAVTCVKFSPSCQFCLIGYGVREPVAEGNPQQQQPQQHPVTAIYRIAPAAVPATVTNEEPSSFQDEMCQISTMLSRDDDVNIARFHPVPGHGFVYGTKQGRVRVVSTRPWMFYHESRNSFGEDNNTMDATMQQG